MKTPARIKWHLIAATVNASLYKVTKLRKRVEKLEPHMLTYGSPKTFKKHASFTNLLNNM